VTNIISSATQEIDSKKAIDNGTAWKNYYC
jgi:hypothetical protein